jgi:hypothetical protein
MMGRGVGAVLAMFVVDVDRKKRIDDTIDYFGAGPRGSDPGRTRDAPSSQTVTRPSDDGAGESTRNPYRDEGGES